MKKFSSHTLTSDSTKGNQSGFTLIELMIVIVILGVLLKIAIPAYSSYTQKAYRTDAKTALLDLASREEKFYSVNNNYTGTLSSLYTGTTGTTLAVQSSGTSYYSVSVTSFTPATATTASAFTAQAIPNVGTSQATDPCGTFQIDNFGNETNVGNTVSPCW